MSKILGPLLPSRFCVNCYHRTSKDNLHSQHIAKSVPEPIPKAMLITKHEEIKEHSNERMEKQSKDSHLQPRTEAILKKDPVTTGSHQVHAKSVAVPSVGVSSVAASSVGVSSVAVSSVAVSSAPVPPKSPTAQSSNSEPPKPDRHEIPTEWKSALESAGITPEEMQNHPKEIWGAVTFMLEGLPVMPSRVEFNEALKESVQLISSDPMIEYKLMGRLGEGGAGAVFLVQQESTGNKFALKKIKPRNDKQRSQILNEIALMELSRHTNILEYYTAYEFGG